MNRLITILLLSLSTLVVGQNLVPNPSFEDTAYCVTGSAQIPAALGWESYENSPDYFHPCTSDPFVSVPNNWGGYQQPASGSAYCAFGSLGTNFGFSNLREFIGRDLSLPLTVGIKYYVSFKVSLSINTFIFSNCATNNLGATFSTLSYHWVTNPASITNSPQVFTSSIITDTLGWTEISGSFIADSAYQYVMFGNFFNDVNTDTLIVYGSPIANCFSYYYLDDVCVSADSLTCYNFSVGIEEPITVNKVNIYPNPTTGQLTISLEETNTGVLSIRNYLGQLIKQEAFNNTKELNISLDGPSGLYFLQLEVDGKLITKKVVKE